MSTIRYVPPTGTPRRQLRIDDLRLEVFDVAAPHRRQLMPHVRRPADSADLLVLLNECAPALHEHHGLHDALEPGRLLLLGPVAPSVIAELPGCRSIVLSLPLSRLGGQASALSGLTDRPIEETILTRTLAGLLRAVVESESTSGSSEDLLARSVLDLVRAVLAEATKPAASDPREHTVRQRALDYIDAHYADPALDPARVATGLGVSLRYAHREFTRGQSTLAATILHRRLAAVDSRLQLDPHGRTASLSELARLTGFASLTTLSRAFRREYGCTMSEYRTRFRGDDAESSSPPL